jgi:hypothetical protein
MIFAVSPLNYLSNHLHYYHREMKKLEKEELRKKIRMEDLDAKDGTTASSERSPERFQDGTERQEDNNGCNNSASQQPVAPHFGNNMHFPQMMNGPFPPNQHYGLMQQHQDMIMNSMNPMQAHYFMAQQYHQQQHHHAMMQANGHSSFFEQHNKGHNMPPANSEGMSKMSASKNQNQVGVTSHFDQHHPGIGPPGEGEASQLHMQSAFENGGYGNMTNMSEEEAYAHFLRQQHCDKASAA